MERGKTLGIVGESGCGKSTTGRVILKLVNPTSGKIIFEGKDITHYSVTQMRPLRCDMQMIFQDPFSSLDPRQSVLQLISEPIIEHHLITGKQAVEKRALELMDIVGLSARYMKGLSSGALHNTTSLEQPMLSCSLVASAVSLMICPISFTASILMPVRVEPTLMEAQRCSVARIAWGMERINNSSLRVMQIWVPSVSLSLGWQPYLSDVTKNWGNKDNWYDTGSSPSFSVVWNLTGLLPWSAQRQNVKTLEDNRKKLQVSRSLVVDSARMEIKKILDTLSQAEEAIKNSDRSISLAQKSYDMTLLAYQSGTKELLDVRDSEAQLNQAKLGKLNEQYNYLTALLDLQYATQITL